MHYYYYWTNGILVCRKVTGSARTYHSAPREDATCTRMLKQLANGKIDKGERHLVMRQGMPQATKRLSTGINLKFHARASPSPPTPAGQPKPKCRLSLYFPVLPSSAGTAPTVHFICYMRLCWSALSALWLGPQPSIRPHARTGARWRTRSRTARWAHARTASSVWRSETGCQPWRASRSNLHQTRTSSNVKDGARPRASALSMATRKCATSATTATTAHAWTADSAM